MPVSIRPGSGTDGPALRGIERSSAQQFRDVGFPAVADDEPASVEELASYAADGRSWVAVDETGALIGYVLVDIVDGNAHIEQVSVEPAHQGAGVGRSLIDRVSDWAFARELPAITLTTFTDVTWNAPLYRHLGFRVLAEDEIGPELLAVRNVEATHGLDPAQRVCMVRLTTR